MEIDPIDQGLLDRPSGMEIEPIRLRPAQSTVGLISNSTRSLFYPTTTMNSPAPNIPGAVSAMSPFTEYMNGLELEATLEDDICAGDETLNAIFAEDHALGVGGGAASAGLMAATPQEGDDHLTAARAMAALCFVHNGQLKIDDATNPHPVCSGYEQGSADPQDADQKPPADKEGEARPAREHSAICKPRG